MYKWLGQQKQILVSAYYSIKTVVLDYHPGLQLFIHPYFLSAIQAQGTTILLMVLLLLLFLSFVLAGAEVAFF